MVENPIVRSKFRPFLYAQPHITPLFPHNKFG